MIFDYYLIQNKLMILPLYIFTFLPHTVISWVLSIVNYSLTLWISFPLKDFQFSFLPWVIGLSLIRSFLESLVVTLSSKSHFHRLKDVLCIHNFKWCSFLQPVIIQGFKPLTSSLVSHVHQFITRIKVCK
jgi:hypothetical protein